MTPGRGEERRLFPLHLFASLSPCSRLSFSAVVHRFSPPCSFTLDRENCSSHIELFRLYGICARCGDTLPFNGVKRREIWMMRGLTESLLSHLTIPRPKESQPYDNNIFIKGMASVLVKSSTTRSLYDIMIMKG